MTAALTLTSDYSVCFILDKKMIMGECDAILSIYLTLIFVLVFKNTSEVLGVLKLHAELLDVRGLLELLVDVFLDYSLA